MEMWGGGLFLAAARKEVTGESDPMGILLEGFLNAGIVN